MVQTLTGADVHDSVDALVREVAQTHRLDGRVFVFYGYEGRHYKGIATITPNGSGPKVETRMNPSLMGPKEYLAELSRCLTGLALICDRDTAYAAVGPFEGNHHCIYNAPRERAIDQKKPERIDIYIGK